MIKVVEKTAGRLIREQVHVDDRHFGVMLGCGITDALFILTV